MDYAIALILYLVSFGLLFLGERGRCSPFYFGALLCQIGAIAFFALSPPGLDVLGAGWGLLALARTTVLPFVEIQDRSRTPASARPPTRNEIWICWAVAGFMVIFATLAFTNSFHVVGFLRGWPNRFDFGWTIKPHPRLATTVSVLSWIVLAPVAMAVRYLKKPVWINIVSCVVITGFAWILCEILQLNFSYAI